MPLTARSGDGVNLVNLGGGDGVNLVNLWSPLGDGRR